MMLTKIEIQFNIGTNISFLKVVASILFRTTTCGHFSYIVAFHNKDVFHFNVVWRYFLKLEKLLFLIVYSRNGTSTDCLLTAASILRSENSENFFFVWAELDSIPEMWGFRNRSFMARFQMQIFLLTFELLVTCGICVFLQLGHKHKGYLQWSRRKHCTTTGLQGRPGRARGGGAWSRSIWFSSCPCRLLALCTLEGADAKIRRRHRLEVYYMRGWLWLDCRFKSKTRTYSLNSAIWCCFELTSFFYFSLFQHLPIS